MENNDLLKSRFHTKGKDFDIDEKYAYFKIETFLDHKDTVVTPLSMDKHRRITLPPKQIFNCLDMFVLTRCGQYILAISADAYYTYSNGPCDTDIGHMPYYSVRNIRFPYCFPIEPDKANRFVLPEELAEDLRPENSNHLTLRCNENFPEILFLLS